MTSKLDELDRLAGLRDRGALSDSEFAQAKAEVLSGGVPAPAASVPTPPHEAGPLPRGVGENDENFPLWAIFRPIENPEEATSLLPAGNLAAIAICVLAVAFGSQYRVTSTDDNIVLIVGLVIFATIFVFAAHAVTKKASVGAAWLLLIVTGCQVFGLVTTDGVRWWMFLMGLTGALTSIQAVRATSAVRRFSSSDALSA